jgi:DNA-binding transcriptional ArsR family regulator
MRYMQTASPTLLPLLRSRSQGHILAAIMLDPQHERSLTELADETGASVSTVLREVARLEQGGLVITTRRGNARIVRAVTDSIVYKPLADLLAVTFGPVAVLRAVLAPISGVERAFIYGSWAARYADRAGPVPHDIDLLVIGDPDRHLLTDAVIEAEGVLRREVNVRRITVDAWSQDRGSFKQTVLSRPVVDVIGGRGE